MSKISAMHIMAVLAGSRLGCCAPAIVTSASQERRELMGTTQATEHLTGTNSK